jgi:hypothetical protein
LKSEGCTRFFLRTGGAGLTRPRKVSSLIFGVAWLLIFAPQALAYLDPGTGSLVVQSVVAALAAIGFGLRAYWRRIHQWFRRPAKRIDSQTEGRPTEPM